MTATHAAQDAGTLITTAMRGFVPDLFNVGFLAVLLVLLLLMLFLVWVLRPSAIRPLDDAAEPVDPIFPRLASTAFQTVSEDTPATPAVDPAEFATLAAEFTEVKDWLGQVTAVLQTAQTRIEDLEAEVAALRASRTATSVATDAAWGRTAPVHDAVFHSAPDRAPSPVPAAPDDDGFDDERLPNAIALATGGMSIEELMRTCSLSYSEAQLVVLVHGRAAAP